MLDESALAQNFYKNPAMVQHAILTELRSRLGGTKVIADSNNSFNFLLEAASEMYVDSILRSEDNLGSRYAKRAQTTEDLYKHVSDFDYVGLFGSPASLLFSIILDKDYLIKNAVKYNDNYNKVIIPKDTIFTIGKYSFGLYYPIEIQINRNTDSINVIYDTNEDNPLHELASNTVEFSEYTFKGLNVLQFQFYIYQFDRTIVTEDLVSSFGFNKEYSYNNNFYAVRAFNYINDTYEEMSYAISNEVYDPTVPTLKITVSPEDGTVRYTIPQVYFTNGLMGNKIEITTFTTIGELSIDISEINSEDIVANFAFNSRNTNEFSSILNSIPVIIFHPKQTTISGGSNGYTYEELRSYIVNNTLYESIPITSLDLAAYFEKKGFSITKYLDNVTDRVFISHRTLVDDNDSPLPVVNSVIYFVPSMLTDITSINENIDGSITFLPTTIYEYDLTNDQCVPLTDTEKSTLMSYIDEDFADKVNNTNYMRTPYHLLLVTDDRYPVVESFNLLDPTTSGLNFVRDNTTMSAQMVVTSHLLTHEDNGTGGYKLRLGITKSTDFDNVDEDDILIYVSASTTAGSLVGAKAEYIGTSNGLSIYDVVISTNYYLSQSNTIGITSLESTAAVVQTQYLSLETDFNIIMAVKRGIFSGVTQDSTITTGLSITYSSQYIGVVKQKLTCTFGKALRGTILNNLNLNWSSESYEVYDTDVYETYNADVYETSEDGSLIYTVVGDEIVLNKLHNKGDVVYDDENNAVVKYAQGTIKYDVNGDPIVDVNRELQYYIDCIFFDLKLFYNDDNGDDDYLATIASDMDSYLTTIEEAAENLLERTNLYFRPTTTFGLGKFALGDDTTVKMSLALSFAITYYVSNYVYTNTKIQGIIKETTIRIIEEELQNDTISMTNISENIKSELNEYIDSVNVGGINDNISLQTLLITDDSVKPTIRQLLVYDNEVFTLDKSVDISYVKI